MSILETAQELIHGDRNVSYGHPRENFKAIKDQWQAYLDNIGDRKLVELDVANMMILMKTARVVNGVYHQDSYTDIAGYAGTAERLQEPTADDHDIWFEAGTGRQFWANFNDIPEGVRVNSADEPDHAEPWVGDPGEWLREGDFGEGPWREHRVVELPTSSDAVAPLVVARLIDFPSWVTKATDEQGYTWEKRGRKWGYLNSDDSGYWNHVGYSDLRGSRFDAPFTEVRA